MFNLEISAEPDNNELFNKQLKILEIELNKYLEKQNLPTAEIERITHKSSRGRDVTEYASFRIASINSTAAERWIPFAKEKAGVKFYKSCMGHYILHL